ncbi:hypothetical protein [Limimaricola soesokkakensis]|uniref:hypothetical protein n=1 Tax=Limimaricola soesokkakensis TaxID=1343159 RepID=UPI003519612B
MTTRTAAAKTAKAVKTASAKAAKTTCAKALKATDATPKGLRPYDTDQQVVLACNGTGGGAINMSEIIEIGEERRDVAAQPAPRHVVIEAPIGAAATKTAIARFNAAAASKAETITVTAPLSVRKMSVQNQLDPQFHLVEDTDSEIRIAGADGRSRALPCAVQTWVWRPEPRPKHALATRHPDFEFCDRAEADVAIQRVGTAAGRLKTPAEAGSAQSHLFLRAVGCSPAELWTRLAAIDFDTVRHNTAAVPSVAKTEIVALYEPTRGIAAAAICAPGKRVSAPRAGRGKHLRRDERLVLSAEAIDAAPGQASDRPAGADRIDGKLPAPAEPVS